jgi:hypothetical protein
VGGSSRPRGREIDATDIRSSSLASFLLSWAFPRAPSAVATGKVIPLGHFFFFLSAAGVRPGVPPRQSSANQPRRQDGGRRRALQRPGPAIASNRHQRNCGITHESRRGIAIRRPQSPPHQGNCLHGISRHLVRRQREPCAEAKGRRFFAYGSRFSPNTLLRACGNFVAMPIFDLARPGYLLPARRACRFRCPKDDGPWKRWGSWSRRGKQCSFRSLLPCFRSLKSI